MARWAPQKKDVLRALASEILHNYGRGRAIVAVDGPASATDSALAGRADARIIAAFADDLAAAIREAGHPAARASIGGFLRSKAERHARGAQSGEGRYDDAYDYSTFRRVLVEPFRMGHGASFVTSAFDGVRDAPVPTKWITAPADAILVVDGEFLNRPELSGVWNYSIWLDLPPDAAGPRSAEQQRYEAEASPRTAATAIIDGGDPDQPRRIFADSC